MKFSLDTKIIKPENNSINSAVNCLLIIIKRLVGIDV